MSDIIVAIMLVNLTFLSAMSSLLLTIVAHSHKSITEMRRSIEYILIRGLDK